MDDWTLVVLIFTFGLCIGVIMSLLFLFFFVKDRLDLKNQNTYLRDRLAHVTESKNKILQRYNDIMETLEDEEKG